MNLELQMHELAVSTPRRSEMNELIEPTGGLVPCANKFEWFG
jgi:hypothetical protein